MMFEKPSLTSNSNLMGMLFAICAGLTIMAGCDDGGSNGSGGAVPASENAVEGVFVDSRVEGLEYKTDTHSGMTDSYGTFRYQEGETIIFSIGDVVLGQAQAKEIVTPIDLVPGAFDETDPAVTNICRFLQSLDVDGDLENGIKITEEIRKEVNGRTIDFTLSVAQFEDDAILQNLFDTLNVMDFFMDDAPRELCSVAAAQNHLRDTLENQGTNNDDNNSQPSPPPDTSEYETKLLGLINNYRTQNSLINLAFDANLNRLAREHSEYMDASNDLNHDGFGDRAASSGFSYCVENAGWNYPTPESMFEGWRSSNGHDLNMLNSHIEYAGISHVGSYITFFACGN